MGYTRRQFVNAAYQEIGLDPEEFDLPASLLQTGMRRLDAMMAEWNRKGIRLSYPMPGSPEDSDLDTETDVPDGAWEAIICNLAIRLAPGRGKQVSPQTLATAKTGLNALLGVSAMPPEIQLRKLPAGAGNKPWRIGDPYTPTPGSPLTAGPDSELEFS